MLKKIIFTALVIFLVLFIARWRQKKSAQIAAQPRQPVAEKQGVAIYYLAGSVVTLMAVAAIYWFFIL